MTEQISVLHLEDDPDILDLMRFQYRDQPDVDGQLVSDPGVALSALTGGSYDCLVSDSVTLSSGEPFVLAARRRSPSIPIVLYTGSDWRDVASVATEAGVDDHVQKTDAAAFERVLERIRSLAGDGRDGTEARLEAVADSSGARSPPDADSSGARSPSDADWSRIGVHDWEAGDELGLTIVQAVERTVGPAAVESSVLYDAVDPDALEALLEPKDAEPSGFHVQVRFPFAGCEIAVRDDGVVAARSLDDD